MTRSACIDDTLIRKARETISCLKREGLTVVTAESCTGGLISAALSQAEGAGDLLHGAFVVYTKANKAMALGVDTELMAELGAVNEEIARQMACGALERSPADIAIAVTGVLGPPPDEDGNPVGLIVFGCCRRGRAPTTCRKDYGDRPHDELRRLAVSDAMTILREIAQAPRWAATVLPPDGDERAARKSHAKIPRHRAR